MKNKLKGKILSGLAGIAVLAATARAAEMPHGRAEVFAGDKKATTDLKVSGNLFGNVNYFARNVNTLDYKDDKFTPFTFVDLTYGLGKGFGAVYETQFIDLGDSTLIQPRFGLEYFKPLSKNLNLYAINTVNVPTYRDPLVNGELVATLRYTPPVRRGSKLNWVLQGETVTNYGEDGLNFAGQKLRAGLGNKRWEAGLGMNFEQTQTSSSRTFGIFGGFNF